MTDDKASAWNKTHADRVPAKRAPTYYNPDAAKARREEILIEMPEQDVREEVVAYTDGAYITGAR